MSDNEPKIDEDPPIDNSGPTKVVDTSSNKPSEAHLIIFPNPEKGNKFRLGLEEYMPMSSSRILLSGLPGVGKRNVILNLIHKMQPRPSCVHLVHCDPQTIEYDCLSDLGIPMVVYEPSDFPTIKNIEEANISLAELAEENEKKGSSVNSIAGKSDQSDEEEPPLPMLQNPLVIIDEITTDQLGKMGQHRFERLVNHVATHRNTTVICSIQSILNIPPKCRRAFNHFVLWKQADKAVDQMAAQRAGITYDILRDFFGLCHDKHDFIWIDLDCDHDSEWRYRLDMISPITIGEPS